ncbi:MAG: hypothetical protein WCI02_11835 [Planctomycetota bacterium]
MRLALRQLALVRSLDEFRELNATLRGVVSATDSTIELSMSSGMKLEGQTSCSPQSVQTMPTISVREISTL